MHRRGVVEVYVCNRQLIFLTVEIKKKNLFLRKVCFLKSESLNAKINDYDTITWT